MPSPAQESSIRAPARRPTTVMLAAEASGQPKYHPHQRSVEILIDQQLTVSRSLARNHPKEPLTPVHECLGDFSSTKQPGRQLPDCRSHTRNPQGGTNHSYLVWQRPDEHARIFGLQIGCKERKRRQLGVYWSIARDKMEIPDYRS